MGVTYSVPEEPPESASQALAARVRQAEGAEGSKVYGSSTHLQDERERGALPAMPAWWATKEAAGVQAALEEALKALPKAQRSHVLDLLGFEVIAGLGITAQVRMRRAFGTDDPAEAKEEFDPMWHSSEEWSEGDTSSEPSAVLLQDLFAPVKGDAGSPAILLRTLVFGALTYADGTHDEYRRVAFGWKEAALKLAIDPPGPQPLVDAAPVVAIQLDGEWLTPDAMALLPEATRAKVKAALVSQLLRAQLDCVANRWAGGFTMLRKRVAPLMSAGAQIEVDKLATLVTLARTGGEPTIQSRSIRAHHAALLKTLGRGPEAAALEAANARDALKFPASVPSTGPGAPGGPGDPDKAPILTTLMYLGCM